MSAAIENHFKLRRPCENCPFRKNGAIQLAPGRLERIVEHLVSNDHSTFQCHKTVHNAHTGGEWDDDGNYVASGQESMCAGAMIYLEKIGRPTVGMRLGRVLGRYDPERLLPAFGDIIDPRTDEESNDDDA
ncbi:hypothetical protein [Burkholderia stagnalis]|uniref:Uncharacterized protein n=1 Tax=Burkholderia stagnalis TaxID=1503054 RepID=A0ABX9YEQ5_9BURK|nr:hypothetical protein [Burkholderia stagnalis]RQQ47595.1 hypothetical protein DF158_33675 [Burkholderia stagnalis]RQQ59314.1 hypothetical protein DF137_33765 [Burkholderia stagnalis]RQQ59792.1 hypothetical protein DF139_33645 [Burkholderia stagnalis]RQQ74135.1 hypothetical protein DF138_33150 [Burkholderia stagnalis]RQQ79887.1 hypothetical protein DF134_33980 [Burkholderia stagnalis]